MMLMAQVDGEGHMFMVHIDDKKGKCLWYLDSDCSLYMCGVKDKFTALDLSFTHSVKLCNNTCMQVNGRGQVKIKLNGVEYTMQDAYYVPQLRNNLLSIGQLQEKGLYFLIRSNVCRTYHP